MERPKRTILIVDDSFPVTERMNCIFEEIGNSPVVLHANSYRESVELLTRLNPAKVLQDMALPDKKGNELLHLFRDQQTEIIILLITGYAGDHFPELFHPGEYDKF